jgi:co-chaperonin GroES (HSP10)
LHCLKGGGVGVPHLLTSLCERSGLLLCGELLRTVGKVVGMGPLAYTGPRFAGLSEPPCKVGDWIAYHSYQGVSIKASDRAGLPVEVRFINDDEILGVVTNPQALMVMV